MLHMQLLKPDKLHFNSTTCNGNREAIDKAVFLLHIKVFHCGTVRQDSMHAAS
jgi:hypothetical protein